MKKLLLLLSCISLISLTACDESSTSNENEQENNETTGDTIEIYLSSQAINIDESESATFSVLLNGVEDISDSAQIINITDGGYDVLKSLDFTTYRPGIHTFFATYGDLTSSQISLTANSESNLSSTYYRRNIVFKFTGTWCTYCPAMSTAIDLAKYQYPDRLIEIAVHNSDSLAVDAGDELYSYCDISGLPSVSIDMNKDYTFATRSSTLIVEKSLLSLEENPTTAGIQIETYIENGTLNIDIEATFTADGDYKIAAALLQSDFNYEQTGTTDTSYRQNHVLRGFFQTNTLGDSIGSMVTQQKHTQHYEYALPSTITDADLEQCSVVVYILNNIGNSIYSINNAAECALGESSPYQFEPILTE